MVAQHQHAVNARQAACLCQTANGRLAAAADQQRLIILTQQQKATVRIRVYPRRVGQRTGKQQQQRRNQRGKSSCVLHRLISFA